MSSFITQTLVEHPELLEQLPYPIPAENLPFSALAGDGIVTGKVISASFEQL
jgi:hypothetical protein